MFQLGWFAEYFCLLALFNTEPLDAKGSAINVITKVTIKLLLHVIHTLQFSEGNSSANILHLSQRRAVQNQQWILHCCGVYISYLVGG